jgi:hypothetical protein
MNGREIPTELYSQRVTSGAKNPCGLSRLLAALALILAFFAPSVLLAAKAFQPPTMACCRKSVHACCKRKAAASRLPSLSASPACQSDCSCSPFARTRSDFHSESHVSENLALVAPERVCLQSPRRWAFTEGGREQLPRPPPTFISR